MARFYSVQGKRFHATSHHTSATLAKFESLGLCKERSSMLRQEASPTRYFDGYALAENDQRAWVGFAGSQ